MNSLKILQLFPITAIINVWGQERRNCILMLGFKGLKGYVLGNLFPTTKVAFVVAHSLLETGTTLDRGWG